tara:strand:+ start:620 stop:1219 length:600 start_codon:yes stop_codon:yes gene_type:complete
MSRLVAFGCSYTRGTGLDDIWDFKNNCSIFPQASKYAWPQLIADRLNLECINLGKGGHSNKAIWHDVLNFDFKYNDLIFIHWSFLDRYHFFEDSNVGHTIDHRSNDPRDQAFFKFLHSDYDMLNDMYMRVNHIDSHLISKGRYHLQISPTPAPTWNKVQLLDTTLDEFKMKYPRANDSSHPGTLAHQDFANSILQKLGY